jgi:hypothetical protein
LIDEPGKIAGSGTELKHSGRRVDARFSYHPREDIVIGRSNGVTLVPYVGVIAIRLVIVIENFAVSTSHNECLTVLDISEPKSSE